MIKSDVHVHTNFSIDSQTKIESQIIKAIKLGFHSLCITDHYDMGYPNNSETFNVDIYFKEIYRLKEKYHKKINLLCGVELGLMPCFKKEIQTLLKKHNFDFVIGSSHLIDVDRDPFLKSFYENRLKKSIH